MQRTWQRGLTVLVFFFSLPFAACEQPKDNRASLSSNQDDADEQIAVTPASVTGSYLRCAYIEDSNAKTNPVGCNPYDGNQRMIDLDLMGNDVRWSYESRLNVTFSKNFVDARNVRWQARFDFAEDSSIDRLTGILDTQISLSFVNKADSQPVNLQDKIRNLLIELAEHRYIKIAYQSLHMNAPTGTEALPDLVDFEFKINGVWEPVLIRLDSLNYSAHTMLSDRFSFQFLGSEADWKMYLSSGMGKDLATLFGNNLDALSWKVAAGDGWTFDATSSFSSQAPYDRKETAKPVELMIDFGQKLRFHGFRLDKGLANPGRTYPNGFPDRFYFLYSDDNKTWTRIQGSESTLDDRSNKEWSWDRS